MQIPRTDSQLSGDRLSLKCEYCSQGTRKAELKKFKGPVCKIEHHVMVRHLFSDIPLDLESVLLAPLVKSNYETQSRSMFWMTVDNMATSLQVDLLFKKM